MCNVIRERRGEEGKRRSGEGEKGRRGEVRSPEIRNRTLITLIGLIIENKLIVS